MTLSRSFFLLAAGICALFVGVAALAFVFLCEEAIPGAEPIAFGAFGIAAVTLFVEARRDLDAVLLLVCTSALTLTAILAVYLASAPNPGEAARLSFGSCLLLAAASGAFTLSRQRSQSTIYPDVLRTLASKAAIAEKEGVQFT